MANERDDEKFGETQGNAQNQPGQPGQQSETGQQDKQSGDSGAPPTTGGQGDTTGQSASGQAQPDSGTDTLTDDPTQSSGHSEIDSAEPIQGEGFIASPGAGSDDYLREDDPTAAAGTAATGGSDFAEKGQGASDKIEDDSGPTGTEER